MAAGRDVLLWGQGLRQQIHLGDESSVERMQALAGPLGALDQPSAREVPRVQRRDPLRQRTLAQWLQACVSREEALWCAYTQSGLRMTDMARELGLSVSRVSRLIARHEGSGGY